VSISKRLAVLCLLAAVVGGVYLQTLRFELLPEDRYHIRSVANLDGIWGILRTHAPQTKPVIYYRPVDVLAFWVDCRLWGDGAWGFHLTNVLLHVSAAWLLFWVLSDLGFRLWALIGALVFAVHPLHAETVSFVAARVEILSAVLAMLCFAFYARRQNGTATRAASVVFFVASVLTKEPLATLPLALLGFDLLCGSERRRGWPFRSLPFWVIAFFYIGLRLTVWYPIRLGALSSSGGTAGPWGGLLRAAGLVLHVAWLPKNLYIDYPLMVISPARALVWILVSALACWLLRGLLRRRDRRIYDWGWVWAAAALLPLVVAYWGRKSVDVDPYLYLPAIGVVFAFASVVRTVRHRRLAAACVLAGVCELAALASIHCPVWASWQKTFRAKRAAGTGGEPKTDLALAMYCIETGRAREASRLCKKAMRVPALAYDAKELFARCLLLQGYPKEAERVYLQLLAERPNDVRCQLGRISALKEQGKLRQAEDLAWNLLRAGQSPFDVRVMLGDIYRREGRFERAAAMYESAARMPVEESLRKVALEWLDELNQIQRSSR